MREDLVSGSQIYNRASIYFDFNAPILTNTVVNTLSTTVDVPEQTQSSILVYPNPARQYIMIRGTELHSGMISVQNLLGQTVLSTEFPGGQEYQLDVRALPAGVYYIQIPSSQGVEIQRIDIMP